MTSSGKVSNALTSIDYSKTIFSPRWFIENMLYIVDKKSQMTKFILNEEQNKLLEHVEFCLENDIPIRMIVLKARQIGSTTFFTALGFWWASMNKNVKYGIVAHMYKSAEAIFEKCKIFYNNLPIEMQPATTQMSGDGITFNKKTGKGINSKVQFATVNEGVYRGETLTYLHLTECAFWEGNVQAIENSLAPTVSINPRTMVVRESTANGYNFFKDDWDRAVQKKSEYTPFFFGWQDHSEYQMQTPKGFTLTEKEEDLQRRFDVTDNQLMWRRYQIDNNYGGNETWFKQENPMTPEEAFVAAGAGVFDAETIVQGYEGCVEPKKMEIEVYPTFEKLLVWEEPQIHEEKIYQEKSVWDYETQEYIYVKTSLVLEEIRYETPYTIGIDTSGMGSDYNQIVVINNITKEMVARYGKESISEEYLAKIAVEIGTYYHNALIVPEINYSHQIAEFILKEGYKHVYIRENIGRQDGGVISSLMYGWKTTALTKPPMISVLRSHLNNNPNIIKDKEFWYEAEYYLMENPQMNKMNAASGHHDDIIIAAAIAIYASDSVFQSKHQPRMVRKSTQHFMEDILRQEKKKTNIRKGIFNNNA